MSFICSPWSELSWGAKQNQNTPRPLIHIACVSQMLPGSNNILTQTAHKHTYLHVCTFTHTQPYRIEEPGSKSKDLWETGHHWRLGIYSWSNSLCKRVCWGYVSDNVTPEQQRSEQELHVEFMCYTTKADNLIQSYREVTYIDFWVSRILTRPFIDLKRETKGKCDNQLNSFS